MKHMSLYIFQPNLYSLGSEYTAKYSLYWAVWVRADVKHLLGE